MQVLILVRVQDFISIFRFLLLFKCFKFKKYFVISNNEMDSQRSSSTNGFNPETSASMPSRKNAIKRGSTNQWESNQAKESADFAFGHQSSRYNIE